MAASNFSGSFTSHDDHIYALKDNNDKCKEEVQLLEIPEDMIEVEVIPDITMSEDDTLQSPLTLTDNAQEQASSGVKRKYSSCSWLSSSKSCYSENGRQEDRTDTNEVSGHDEYGQGEGVIELYLTDEDIPTELKEKLWELEGHCKVRTVKQTNKRPKDSVKNGDNENKHLSEKIPIADVLFGGDNSALNFQWSPMSSFVGEQEVFQPSNAPGPRQPTSCGYEAFRQYWDDKILQHIVRETNRHAAFISDRDWKDTNIHEILVLFAFWIMLGIIKMPKINLCFSRHPLLKSNIFRNLFTKKRYWLLNKALHFVDSSKRNPNSSKLFPFGPLLDHLNEKFKEAYTPDQDLSIDESLTLWKGRLSFKQRIKSKSIKEGIKTYELCESATGYLWSFIIYTGKDRAASRSVLPKNTDVVVQLMKPLLNKGYKLFLDSSYNSPLLARFLKRNRTDCVGTLLETRKYVPNLIKVVSIPEGTCVARHSGDVVVMAYQDKRTIYTISTCHGTNSVPLVVKHRTLRYKPSVIVDYNKSIGGVDKMNQLLKPYLLERQRCSQWHIKMFKRLLNVSILNSRILVDKSIDDEVKQLAFRLKLVEKILKHHLSHMPERVERRVILSKYVIALPEVRFKGLHFVVHNDFKKRQLKTKGKGNRRQYCVWCRVRCKKKRLTMWKCEVCNVPLCLPQCFKGYHTVI